MKNLFEKSLQLEYKLSDQAKLTIISLFQKALVTMEDVSGALDELRVQLDDDGGVVFTNPEICQLTEKDLEKLSESLQLS